MKKYYVYLIKSTKTFSKYEITIDNDIKIEKLGDEEFSKTYLMIQELILLEENRYVNVELFYPILTHRQIDYLYNNERKNKSSTKLKLALF